MKILVVGSGLTGCTFARILYDEGNKVEIIEKLPHIGGLCYTKTSPNGFLYEPYGSKVFHTNKSDVKEFVTRFVEFNNYTHFKGVIIKGRLYHFPISYKEIEKMPEKEKIYNELRIRPLMPDRANFETYLKNQLMILNWSLK